MKLYRKIDDYGLFVEDVILESIPKDEEDNPDSRYIDVPVPNGFFHPRWDGEKWVEGLSEEEIKELTKPQPKELSLEERLESIKTQNELALAELAEVILGGMN